MRSGQGVYNGLGTDNTVVKKVGVALPLMILSSLVGNKYYTISVTMRYYVGVGDIINFTEFL